MEDFLVYITASPEPTGSSNSPFLAWTCPFRLSEHLHCRSQFTFSKREVTLNMFEIILIVWSGNTPVSKRAVLYLTTLYFTVNWLDLRANSSIFAFLPCIGRLSPPLCLIPCVNLTLQSRQSHQNAVLCDGNCPVCVEKINNSLKNLQVFVAAKRPAERPLQALTPW